MSEADVLAPVSMTPRATRRVAEILRGEPDGAMLRLAVNGGGCSGFQYSFEIDTIRDAADLAIGTGQAILLIDPISLDFVKGAEVDFVDDLIGQSFKVANPNAKSSCGCGVSFAF